MMAHKRSMERKSQSPSGGMAEQDPLQQPTEEDTQSPPEMTHHHEDGTHTTVHADGSEHHHQNVDELANHLHRHSKQQENLDGETDEAEYQ
jgi:hypothetical protein